MSHKARIVTISKLSSIPNKDRIRLASIEEIPDLGVIVGTEAQVGDVMVYFPENTQLSDEFCVANDLYEKDLGNGKRSGYFDHKRRVKILKLGGTRSEGFLAPLTHFNYLKDEPGYKETLSASPGFEFDKIGIKKICKKYRVIHSNQPAKPKTRWEKLKAWLRDKKIERNYYSRGEFRRHPDTEHLRDHIRRIPIGSELIVTEKIHGQSARTAKLRNLSWWQKALEKLSPVELFDINTLMVGTRETILNHRGFYKMEFRREIARKFALCELGEDFSYEIAGFDDNGNPLQKHHLDKLLKGYTIPSIQDFPDPSIYTYGCEPGTRKEFVYKLSKIEDGIERVCSWDETVKRCKELGVNTVPLLERFIYDGDAQATLDRLNKWLANDQVKPSTLDFRHIIEGICVRVEEQDVHHYARHEWKVFKHKSFLFRLLEGHNIEKGLEEKN